MNEEFHDYVKDWTSMSMPRSSLSALVDFLHNRNLIGYRWTRMHEGKQVINRGILCDDFTISDWAIIFKFTYTVLPTDRFQIRFRSKDVAILVKLGFEYDQ